MSRHARPPRSLAGRTARLAVAAAVLLLASSSARPARAQWGWGYGGWGMGMGGQIGNMAVMNNINQRSAAAANAAYAARQTPPGTGRSLSSNPNSSLNQVRDTTFTQRFDPSTRRTATSELARLPESAPAVAATAARVVQPLANFFTAAGVLAWPAGAPTTGALAASKEKADAAAHAVYLEHQARGGASVGLVTDARTRLIAYGQPALRTLRESTTPAVADAFHRFLLGLYDALGAAALGVAPAGR